MTRREGQRISKDDMEEGVEYFDSLSDTLFEWILLFLFKILRGLVYIAFDVIVLHK